MDSISSKPLRWWLFRSLLVLPASLIVLRVATWVEVPREPERPIIYVPVTVESLAWEMCVDRSEDKTLKPNQPVNPCFPAKIKRYDSIAFAIDIQDGTNPQGIVMNFDKSLSKEFGTWQKYTTPDRGTWKYREAPHPGQALPTVFTITFTDQLGQKFPATLTRKS